MYKTVERLAIAELIEKKSRFTASVCPVKTQEEALEFLNSIRAKYSDANHNVYAYSIRENNIMRYSDDGEPSGTAGVPVIDIIRKEEIVDVIVVITRYFGGTLLGTGGLVRAYSGAAIQGLKAANVITMGEFGTFMLQLDYTLLGKVENLLNLTGAVIEKITYEDNVKIFFYISKECSGSLIKKLIDATNANIIVKETGYIFAKMP